MSLSVFFASRNVHKVKEAQYALQPFDIRVLSWSSIPSYMDPQVDPEESHPLLLGNALQKAQHGNAFVGCDHKFYGITVGDDSGLFVPALNGQPGVRSKRYSGKGTDLANVTLLLENMRNLKGEERKASYKCVLVWLSPQLDQHVITAEQTGRIAETSGSDGGFGYDTVFIPDGETFSMSVIHADKEKYAKLSHRHAAFTQLGHDLILYGL